VGPFRLGYKTQSINSVEGNNSCFYRQPYRT